MKFNNGHISDLGRIVTGKTPKTSIKENYGGDIPFLTPSDNLNNKYAPKTIRTLTHKGLEEVKNCLLPKGSICVSCIGADLGKVVITKEKTVTNQQINSIIPNDDNDVDFIYYLMTYIGDRLNILSKTSTAIPIINKSTFSNFEINIPELKNQTKIASILSSLDDKIENNRRINENLEQQAQALFKSWFVDFEPFRDQPFVESELGMIPESLSVEYISDIPHIIETGRRPKGGVNKFTSGVPSVGAEHVKGLGNYDFSKTKFITPEYAETLKTGKINGYELLIYKDGGKPGYFIPNFSIFGEGYPFEKCYLNEHVFKLDFNDKGFNIFCYFFFKTKFIMNYLNAQGAKAAIPGINRQDIERIPIYSPSNERIMKFGEIALPLIKKILVNCKESQKLARTRDMLLPKLMSGEIKV